MQNYQTICEAIKKRKWSLNILKRRLNKSEKKLKSIIKKHGPEVKETSKEAIDLVQNIQKLRQQISSGY